MRLISYLPVSPDHQQKFWVWLLTSIWRGLGQLYRLGLIDSQPFQRVVNFALWLEADEWTPGELADEKEHWRQKFLKQDGAHY
jgi:hypothetical protein